MVTIEWNYSMRRLQKWRERNREEKADFFPVRAKLGVYLSWCREITSVLVSLPCSVWLRFNCAHTKMGATVATMMTATAAKPRLQWKSAKWKWECASARARNRRKKNNDFRQAAERTFNQHYSRAMKQERTGRCSCKSSGKMWLSYLPPNTIHNDT